MLIQPILQGSTEINNEASKVYVNNCKFYNLLNVNNDALIVMCVAPEGLLILTDHMSKGSLIVAIGGTIEDYRLSHKKTIRLCEE